MNYKAAGKWGGHAQGQTTINIYAHATRSVDDKAAEIMDKVYNPELNKENKKFLS